MEGAHNTTSFNPSNDDEFLRKVQLALAAPLEADVNENGNNSSISSDEAEFRKKAWLALAPLYEAKTSDSNGNDSLKVSNERGHMKTGGELEKEADWNYGAAEASVGDVRKQEGQLAPRKRLKFSADREACASLMEEGNRAIVEGGKAKHAMQAAASTVVGSMNGGHAPQLGNMQFQTYLYPTKEQTQHLSLVTGLPEGTISHWMSLYNSSNHLPFGHLNPYPTRDQRSHISIPSVAGNLKREYHGHGSHPYPMKDQQDLTNISEQIMPTLKPSKKNSSVDRITLSSYNIYYILERELVFKEQGIPSHVKDTSAHEWINYGDLASVFPPRPKRYEALDLSRIWFLKRKGRSRNLSTKNHATIPLDGLSTAIAKSWKSCEPEVIGYVKAVAKIIKKRRDEIVKSKNGTKSICSSPSNKSNLPWAAGHPKREYDDCGEHPCPTKDQQDLTNISEQIMPISKPKPSKKNGSVAKKTLSRYNIYYILERELLFKQKEIRPQVKDTSALEWINYGDLANVFPPRPKRYEALDLSDIWFLKRKGQSQRNRFMKAKISLDGLSTAIAKSWKSCEPEVKVYVTAVANIIKNRHCEIQMNLHPRLHGEIKNPGRC